MIADTNTDIAVLNDLIETCKDGVDGFRTSAAAVTAPDAKALFTSRITIIEHAAAELQAAVRALGGDPETSGHVAAAIHRGWIDLKSAVTGKSDAAILTECERGEQVAVSNYEAALKKELSPETRAIVERQYRGTVQNLEKVRALGHATGASTPTVAPTPDVDKGTSPTM